MKHLIGAIAALLIFGVGFSAWWITQEAPKPPDDRPAVLILDPTAGRQKPSCASCGDARHPTPPLLKADYDRLLAQYALEPIQESAALDALCYYGIQTRDMLAQFGTGTLDKEREEFLRREVRRTHAFLSVRVIDEHGVVRVSMMRKRVQFDRRSHHEVDEVVDVVPPEISGTVKRVGLYHIWARF